MYIIFVKNYLKNDRNKSFTSLQNLIVNSITSRDRLIYLNVYSVRKEKSHKTFHFSDTMIQWDLRIEDLSISKTMSRIIEILYPLVLVVEKREITRSINLGDHVQGADMQM